MLRRRHVGAAERGSEETGPDAGKSVANPAAPPFLDQAPEPEGTQEPEEQDKAVEEPKCVPVDEREPEQTSQDQETQPSAAAATNATAGAADCQEKETPAKAPRRPDPHTRALLVDVLAQGKSPRAFIEFSPSGKREVVDILPPEEFQGREPEAAVDELLEGRGNGQDWTFGLALPKTPEGETGKLIIGGIVLDIGAIGGQSATLGVTAGKLAKWLAQVPADGVFTDGSAPWFFNGLGLPVLVGLGAWLVLCLLLGFKNLDVAAQAPAQVLQDQLDRNLANIPVPEDSPLYGQYKKYYEDEFESLSRGLKEQSEASRPKALQAFSLRALLELFDWHAVLQTFTQGVGAFCAFALLCAVGRLFLSPAGDAKLAAACSWVLERFGVAEEKERGCKAAAVSTTREAAATAETESDEHADAVSPDEKPEAVDEAGSQAAATTPPAGPGPVPVPLSPSVEAAQPAGPMVVPLSPRSAAAEAGAEAGTSLLGSALPPAAAGKQGLPFILEGPNGEPMVVHLPLPPARAAAEAPDKQQAYQPRIDYGASPQRQKLQRKIAARERGQPPRAAGTPAAGGGPAQGPVAGEKLGEKCPESLDCSGDDPLGDETAVEALLRELEDTPKVSKKKRQGLRQPTQGRTPKGGSTQRGQSQQTAAASPVEPELVPPSPEPPVPSSEKATPRAATPAKSEAPPLLDPAPVSAKDLEATVQPSAPAQPQSGRRKGSQTALKEQAAPAVVQQQDAAKGAAKDAVKEDGKEADVAKELTKDASKDSTHSSKEAAKEAKARQQRPAAAVSATGKQAGNAAANTSPQPQPPTPRTSAARKAKAPSPPTPPAPEHSGPTPGPTLRQQPPPLAHEQPQPQSPSPPPPPLHQPSAGRSPVAAEPPALQEVPDEGQEPTGGDWDIALSRSTRRRSRATTDGNAGPPTPSGQGAESIAQAPAAGGRGQGSAGKAAAAAPKVQAVEHLASPEGPAPRCSVRETSGGTVALADEGAAKAVLEELKQMRKDELLRWFTANSALGWLNDRLNGAQITDSTPKSVLLEQAALLLGSTASVKQQQNPQQEEAEEEEDEASSEEQTQAAAERGGGDSRSGTDLKEEAAQPRLPPPIGLPKPTPTWAGVAPTPAPLAPAPSPPPGPLKSPSPVPGKRPPPVAAPAVQARVSPVAKQSSPPAPKGAAKEEDSTGLTGSSMMGEASIRFGDFEPPAVPPPSPPQAAEPYRQQPEEAAPGVEEAGEGPSSPPEAPQSQAAGPGQAHEAMQMQHLQQQQQPSMMVMQPALAAGGMALLHCMPGMASVPMGYPTGMQPEHACGQQPGAPAPGAPQAQQLQESQAACQQLVPGMPGADVIGMQQGMQGKQQLMPFVPFMPAMAGATSMPMAGQQAMHMPGQQFVPVMFAVPFNPVSSQEGGAAGNLQGMMMPMPMAAAGDYGGMASTMGCMGPGTVPGAGVMGVPMGAQQAMATLGAASCLPFGAGAEPGSGGAARPGHCEGT